MALLTLPHFLTYFKNRRYECVKTTLHRLATSALYKCGFLTDRSFFVGFLQDVRNLNSGAGYR